MIIVYIAIRVKEILMHKTLVTLGSEPTQNIINEKLMDPPLPTASISMSGDIEIGSECDIDFSPRTLHQLKSGDIKVIIGYQESFCRRRNNGGTERAENGWVYIFR